MNTNGTSKAARGGAHAVEVQPRRLGSPPDPARHTGVPADPPRARRQRADDRPLPDIGINSNEGLAADVTASGPSSHLVLSDDMSWLADFVGPILRGTTLLASGDPGVGKSTLALQVAASAALADEQVLVISTEQTSDALRGRLKQIARPLDAPLSPAAISITHDLRDLAMLPRFLASQVFHPNGRYRATTFLVLDSLQGQGIAANDKRSWEPIYESLRLASAAGLVTLALAHMTKSRQIAGPRTLEHNVDAVLMMRHGVSARALTIPKNRNAPSRMEALSLVIDPETTRLVPSPLGDSATARARTIASDGLVEIEAALSLPRHDRGFVKAPGLAAREVETVVDLLERTMPCCRHLWAIGVTVRGPAGLRQNRDHNLAIAAAILAALYRAEPPGDLLFVGDLTLDGIIQPPSDSALGELEDAQAAGLLGDVRAVVAAKETRIAASIAAAPPFVEVNRIADLLKVLGGVA